MNELNVLIENIPGKLESHQKIINLQQMKQKCLFCHSFIFFMRLRLNFQLVVFIYAILSENLLNGTSNLIQQRKR